MQATPCLLSFILVLLSHSGRASGLCNLENGTVAVCSDLEDVKYIETYDLESLKARASENVLGPSPFGNLSSLRHLDLSKGEIKRVEPGSFRRLSNLKSLDLSENRIEYLELASLDGLHQLRTLNLRGNSLRQLPPALARLKNLRHLEIQGNPFRCNCATLRVRDLVIKRGVKISKKAICAGPGHMKGTSLLKPDASIICAFEEQDREMQKDQAFEGSGDEGSGDAFDELAEDDLFFSQENSKESEIETPYPDVNNTFSTATPSAQDPTKEPTTITDASLERTTGEDGLFFDSEEKKDRSTTSAETTTRAPVIKDALFYPVEGSGDEEEGSAEGPGIISQNLDEETSRERATSVEPTTSGESFLDILFGTFWGTTAAPEEKQEPDLEEEQFIPASSTESPVEETVASKKMFTLEQTPTTESTTSNVETMESENEASKLGNVKAESDDSVNDELSEVSPARQSKKGMGSYVVLAALLAVLAALIGFAAYKGDFCKKRRKRGDVETGTEMKDMQKSLLDGNSTQPKIASNGSPESVPLVDGTRDQEDSKDAKPSNETVKASNGTDHADPVKPPRKTVESKDEEKLRTSDSPREDLSSDRTSPVESITVNNGPMTGHTESNGPPVSPGAQRVKITLQENPDSVPKTPILITRTMAGENLVKTP